MCRCNTTFAYWENYFICLILGKLLYMFMWKHEKTKEFWEIHWIKSNHQFFGMFFLLLKAKSCFNCLCVSETEKLENFFVKTTLFRQENSNKLHNCTFTEHIPNLILFFEFKAFKQNAHLILISLTLKPSECQCVERRETDSLFCCRLQSKRNWMPKFRCMSFFHSWVFPNKSFDIIFSLPIFIWTSMGSVSTQCIQWIV